MSKLFCLIIFNLLVSCSSNKISDAQKKADIFYQSGTQNLISKKYTEALSDFLEAAKLDPKNPEVHNNLGMAYYFKSELSLAIQHLQKAMELDPKDMNPVNNLSNIYYAQGKYAEAKAGYEKILKDLTYQNQFRTYYNLGLIELLQKNKTKARELFSKSLEDNENYCPAYFQLGTLDFEAQNYQAAYDNFKNAGIGECINNAAEANYYQALTSWKLGNAERAKLKFIDITKRFPKSPMATKAQLQIDRLIKLEVSSASTDKNQDDNTEQAARQTFVSPEN